MANTEVGLRKRQQIEKTGKVMFTWIVVASALVAVALVVSFSIVERLMFNQRIIGVKSATSSNLKNNNEIVEQLRENVRVINTNQDLLNTQRAESVEPVSVVLDALPAQANSSALGASLQKKLLKGVTIESLVVDPIAEENGQLSVAGRNEILFSFIVSAPASEVDKIKDVIRKLEQSIRTINVRTIGIEQRSSRITLSVDAVAYYAPETTVDLKTTLKKPSDEED